jgi:inner membrane transporter RhtA
MWAGYIVAGSRIALADRGLSGLAVGLVAGSLVIAPFGVPGAGAAFGGLSFATRPCRWSGPRCA